MHALSQAGALPSVPGFCPGAAQWFLLGLSRPCVPWATSSPHLAGWVCTLGGTQATDTLTAAHSPGYSWGKALSPALPEVCTNSTTPLFSASYTRITHIT